MKTQEEILNDLITDFVSSQNKITYFGTDSIIRAIFYSFSYALSEAWQELYSAKRKAQVQTATGIDLDFLADKYGLIRLGSSKSTIVVNFSGSVGTIIPVGTIVTDSSSNIQYVTKYTITLGKNQNVTRPLQSDSLGDSVIAESEGLGIAGKIEAGMISKLGSNTIDDDITVTNMLPSIGGIESETDEDFRKRIMERFSVLNLNTQAFYETLAKTYNPSVYRAKAKNDPQNLGVKIYLTRRDFSIFAGGELIAIADYIYTYQKAMSSVVCTNATIKGIHVAFNYKRDSRFNAQQIYSQSAKIIGDYITSIFDFGATVEYFELYKRILQIEGISEMRQSTFYLNDIQKNIILTETEVPRFVLLTASDGTVIEYSIDQEYSSL